MSLFKILEFQFYPASCTRDRFPVGRGEDFLGLKDSLTHMIEMPACMLFIEWIRDKCEYHMSFRI
jgi:hypothetical protein